MSIPSAAYGDTVDFSASPQTATRMSTNPADLAHTSKEFESILLGQWLQSAESSFGSVPEGEDESDAGEEQMKGFAVQQLAKSFSDSGGIGIARLVLNELDHSTSASSSVHESHATVFK